jgi:hypothetical protein
MQNLFVKKAKNTVSEILSDFQTKVTELQELAQRKVDEVTQTELKISDLKVVKDSAQLEADRANRAANKISKFLAE